MGQKQLPRKTYRFWLSTSASSPLLRFAYLLQAPEHPSAQKANQPRRGVRFYSHHTAPSPASLTGHKLIFTFNALFKNYTAFPVGLGRSNTGIGAPDQKWLLPGKKPHEAALQPLCSSCADPRRGSRRAEGPNQPDFWRIPPSGLLRARFIVLNKRAASEAPLSPREAGRAPCQPPPRRAGL